MQSTGKPVKFTFLYKTLHGLPSLTNRNRSKLHYLFCASRVVDPLWWVTNRKGNILETDGEVDEVKVEVLKAEILQTPPAGRLYMFRSMKRVP